MLTGSTEMQSASLQEKARQAREAQLCEVAADAERALVQQLYEARQGVCDYCGTRIAQPADATTIRIAGTDRLIHAAEWLTASLSRVKRHLSSPLSGRVR